MFNFCSVWQLRKFVNDKNIPNYGICTKLMLQLQKERFSLNNHQCQCWMVITYGKPSLPFPCNPDSTSRDSNLPHKPEITFVNNKDLNFAME